MRRLIFALPIAAFAVVAAAFLWGLNSDRNPNEIPSVMIDKSVPSFALPPLEGSGVPGLDSDGLNSGAASLVNVFASWCLPCRIEHPLLMEMSRSTKIPIFGINYKDKSLAARTWLEELGNPYRRIGADLSGRVAIDWGVYGVPETFVVDREGRIRYRHVGPLDRRQLEEVILPIIERLNR